ncbi:MAG: NADH-quinone oxidoreductase subunit D, partial [Thermodesulfobacteriota bacterium]
LDYMCAMSNNLAYVQAVETLLDIEITDRAKFIRTMAAELSRIAGHLLAIGAWALDLGAMTILLYAMREREIVLDIFEQLCGSRMTLTYMRIGGVRYDFTEKCKELTEEFLKLLGPRLDEYDRLLTGNRVWIKRNRDVGVLTADQALDLGLSGPAMRASGIKWDIRKDEPYLLYDSFDFEVPTGTNGDCLDRYYCRMGEIRQSAKIISQALDLIPDGPINVDIASVVPPPKPDVYRNMENLIHHFKYVSQGFKVPAGEVYSSIEAPKGELGVYIASDGSEKPHRLKLRVPSFMNLQTINAMSQGMYLADVIAIVSSLDPVFGECDK